MDGDNGESNVKKQTENEMENTTEGPIIHLLLSCTSITITIVFDWVLGDLFRVWSWRLWPRYGAMGFREVDLGLRV